MQLRSLTVLLLLAATPALAEPSSASAERDRIRALEQHVSSLAAEVAALKSGSSAMRSRPSRAQASARLALLSYMHPGFGALGMVPPIFGARITSAGGGTITSAQMIDPYVPVDGTMNVTGAIETTGRGYFNSGTGGVLVGSSAGKIEWASGSSTAIVFAANPGTRVGGGTADGATAVAVRIEAGSDLATAGAKIASFGDNAAVTYAEKAYVALDGTIGAAGYRGTIGSSLSAAASDITAATFRASQVFPADTSSNAVDVEISEALDALDVGMDKIFRVATGHATNALTVTADASGVTTATLIQQGVGASCEDVNDFFRVTVKGTQAITVESYCAD